MSPVVYTPQMELALDRLANAMPAARVVGEFAGCPIVAASPKRRFVVDPLGRVLPEPAVRGTRKDPT